MWPNLMEWEEEDSGLHVIKLYKPDCGPCRLYASVFERAAAQKSDVNFHSVDITQDPGIGQWLDVQSVPTTVIFKNGGEVARVSGAISSRMLDNFLAGR